jgi:DNA-binding CsgD family transcriptional regulator
MSRSPTGSGEPPVRALTFRLRPPEGPHPAYRLFDEGSGISRERIYNLNVLDDGTVVLLGRVRGDLDRVRELVAGRTEVLGYSVSGGAGSESRNGDGSGGERSADGGLVFVHARPPPELARFLTLPRTHEVFLDFPIEGTPEGGLRVVMLGETNAVLQRAFADVPAELAPTVERLGPYADGPAGAAALLTDRQREVLAAAQELGYYEVPRRATHRDVADRLGLSVGTVGEHLQKIEARVLGTLAARPSTDGR